MQDLRHSLNSPKYELVISDSDPVSSMGLWMFAFLWKSINLINKNKLSHMRPQAKPKCGKWSYIDPLVMSFSSKILLWHCFYNAYSTFSLKMTFPFWAIWALFTKDFVVPLEHVYSCITRTRWFSCITRRHGQNKVLDYLEFASRPRICQPGYYISFAFAVILSLFASCVFFYSACRFHFKPSPQTGRNARVFFHSIWEYSYVFSVPEWLLDVIFAWGGTPEASCGTVLAPKCPQVGFWSVF